MPAIKTCEVSSHIRAVDRVLITTFNGHVIGDTVERMLEQIRGFGISSMPPERQPTVWLVDATKINGFDANGIREPGANVVELVSRTCKHLVLVIDTSSLSGRGVVMIARALTFMSLKLVEADNLINADRIIAGIRKGTS